MSAPDILETTDTDIQSLRATVDAKHRQGSTMVAVDREALRRLLNDHHTLITISQRKANWKPSADQVSLT